MTKTTTLFYTHEELKALGLSDEKMKDCGFFKKSYDTIGKVFEKIEHVSIKEAINGNSHFSAKWI